MRTTRGKFLPTVNLNNYLMQHEMLTHGDRNKSFLHCFVNLALILFLLLLFFFFSLRLGEVPVRHKTDNCHLSQKEQETKWLTFWLSSPDVFLPTDLMLYYWQCVLKGSRHTSKNEPLCNFTLQEGSFPPFSFVVDLSTHCYWFIEMASSVILQCIFALIRM